MSTIFKLRRGTTSQHSTFTGAAGEATIDTTKNTVVVHDGITAGGIPLAKGSQIVSSITSLVAGTGLSGGTITTTGTIAIDSTVATLTGTQSLTNKTITSRVSSTTSIASPLVDNSDTFDVYAATAQSATLTVNADSGTPTDGRKMQFRFVCDATPRVITFIGGVSKGFKPVGITMTESASNWTYTLTASKATYFGAIYNLASTRWEIVAISQEA